MAQSHEIFCCSRATACFICDWVSFTGCIPAAQWPLGCSVLGRCAEPLVRTQFPEHPPTLNFGANHLKNGFGTLKNPPSPFFPHTTRIAGVFFGGEDKELAELEQS